jgi:hypothetical protein
VGASMTSGARDLQQAYARRGLRVPKRVEQIFRTDVPERLGELLLGPAAVDAAEEVIDSSPWPILPNLVPLLALDELSYACVVASDIDGRDLPGEGAVVRWHVGVERDDQQAALLDTDCFDYAESVAEEMAARDIGARRVLERIGPAYEESYLARGEKPRDFVVRPIRIACQNVIVALAAIAQESGFDGLSVVAWQTCEVAHVAAHEANRALAVLTLCDAFQNGGTMEIRFDKPAWVRFRGKEETFNGHPERRVPASLRRFARTVGVGVGVEDPAAISPAEARNLFEAITPTPDELRTRVRRVSAERGIPPERLCFTLLKPIWRAVELDYLLATSARSKSILSGGAPWHDRVGRQAESETCRAAVMIGMLQRRLDATDAAGADRAARVVEDRRRGVTWSVIEGEGAVRFSNLAAYDGDPLPWASPAVAAGEDLTIFPRSLVSRETIDRAVAAGAHGPVAIVVPTDTDLPSLPEGLLVLRCPDRRPDIDRVVEEKLLASRISRA